MLTFILWKWKGWRDIYSVDHVNAVRRMISSNVSLPHKIVTITDDPAGIDGETFPMWETFEITGWVKPQNCFHRLRLFDSWASCLGDHLVSFDLDQLILGNIDEFFVDLPSFKGLQGRYSYISGSLWAVRPGAHEEVWKSFDPQTSGIYIQQERTKRHGSPLGEKLYGSDQAWMSLKLPVASRWPSGPGTSVLSYGIDLRHKKYDLTGVKLISFAGRFKPWGWEVEPEFQEIWRRYS